MIPCHGLSAQVFSAADTLSIRYSFWYSVGVRKENLSGNAYRWGKGIWCFFQFIYWYNREVRGECKDLAKFFMLIQFPLTLCVLGELCGFIRLFNRRARRDSIKVFTPVSSTIPLCALDVLSGFICSACFVWPGIAVQDSEVFCQASVALSPDAPLSKLLFRVW